MADDARAGDLSFVIEPSQDGFEVPSGWGQARGTFGGVVLGGMLRAVMRAEPEADRWPRSISGELAGPVMAGPATIHAAAVRRGNGVSTWSARLDQGDGTLAVANVVLGRTRDIDRTWSQEVVAAPPWRDCPAMPVALAFVPEFSQHFEYRPFGPMPFSGSADPVSAGWIRPRVASRGIGPAELVALADAWWPAGFSVERAPRPIATVAFTMQCLLGGRVLPADTPLLHRARVIASAQGFFVEFRELWTEAGELVALNQQTFVWIR